MEKKVKETKKVSEVKKTNKSNKADQTKKVVVESTDYTNILKRIFYVLIIIAIILGITLIVDVVNMNSTGQETNNSTDNEEISGEYDVSMFDEMTTTEVLDKVAKKGTEVVYIGRSTCGYCVQFLPILQQAQSEYGYKTIYIDLEKMSSDDQTNILNVDNEEGYIKENLGYTPMVLVFKDGKLSQGWVGYAEYDSFASFLEDNGFKK